MAWSDAARAAAAEARRRHKTHKGWLKRTSFQAYPSQFSDSRQHRDRIAKELRQIRAGKMSNKPRAMDVPEIAATSTMSRNYWRNNK